jgi:hypothetical protein
VRGKSVGSWNKYFITTGSVVPHQVGDASSPHVFNINEGDSSLDFSGFNASTTSQLGTCWRTSSRHQGVVCSADHRHLPNTIHTVSPSIPSSLLVTKLHFLQLHAQTRCLWICTYMTSRFADWNKQVSIFFAQCDVAGLKFNCNYLRSFRSTGPCGISIRNARHTAHEGYQGR